MKALKTTGICVGYSVALWGLWWLHPALVLILGGLALAAPLEDR